MEEKLNDQMLIRRGKLEKITALGFEPYGGKYECTHHSEDIHANAAALEASGEHVKVAGRIMIIRGHGKRHSARFVMKRGYPALFPERYCQ